MEYGLIGQHLSHSWSKDIHEAFGEYTYEYYDVEIEEFEQIMKAREFKGVNITMPYKETVIPFLDELDESAKAVMAVNTIANRDGKLIGYNTDVAGFRLTCKNHGVDVKGKKVLVLGTGGASKAAMGGLTLDGAGEIIFVSRLPKPVGVSYEDAKQNHTDAQIIVNCTPVGMFPATEGQAMDLTPFTNCEAVVDVIYNPPMTDIQRQAQSMGMTIANGLDMVVGQAFDAAEHFLDKKLTKEQFDAAMVAVNKKMEQIING